jgi:UDP-glucuronate decarboxylase
MSDLAKLFVEIEGNGASFELIPYPENYPAGEPQRRCPDISKAKTDLAYEPTVSLKQGLKRFIDWCRNEEAYVGKKPEKKLAHKATTKKKFALKKKSAKSK